jgi:hypothetical protein
MYRPVADNNDFRVQMQEDELELLRAQVEADVNESMGAMLRTPLERLRAVVQKLNEVTGKGDREAVNKKTGALETRPPIFRDSVVENIAEEINLLHDFAAVLPTEILTLARTVADTTPHAQTLRDDPALRQQTHVQTASLLAAIDDMLND